MITPPCFIVLTGLPGAGKSTLRQNIKDAWNCEHILVQASTDDYIELTAQMCGKTYSEVFWDTIGEATRCINEMLANAVAARNCVILDQTNLGTKKRRATLASLPKDYVKVSILVECDEDERQRQLVSRLGKVIPAFIDEDMQRTMTKPSLDEGFDVVTEAAMWRKALAPYLFG